MDGVVEIITGRERRRRWSLQDKAKLVAETNESGAMIRAVAARHGVCESLLFTWRRQAREGLLGLAPENAVFVPVQALTSTGTAWMLSRCSDATEKTAPRELIHLLKSSREKEFSG